MSLMEMGREHLERSNIDTRGMDRMTLATQILNFRSGGMMSTSDFSSLLANVANKRLRQGYEENQPSYQRWARRAPDAPDFKSMAVVNLAGAPDLLKVNEHGEFTVGAMTDGKETYSMLTYGRIVPFTRQAIINDDLRGFDRLVGAFGNSAARLENRTVYAILTANAALADTGALFNATAVTTAGGHANLTSAGTAISVASLGVGRTAMRRQVGLQSEELNLTPSFLIVPATQEQLAYQYTSANYVPATPANVNEFRSGGRTALEPVVEAILDANSTTAWYLAAQTGQVDTVEYCYLQGAAGPVIESEMGFETDGISYKCRLDFAAKAIDFRGLYKNVGA
jgi:phage tail protein X